MRLLESSHLDDIVRDKILEYGHDHINAVIVANDNIENIYCQISSNIIQSMCRVCETDEGIIKIFTIYDINASTTAPIIDEIILFNIITLFCKITR